MGFWDIFGKSKAQETYGCRLHKKLAYILPTANDKQLTLITCIAGLLARIAYADMKFQQKEVDQMKIALTEWSSLPREDIQAVIRITQEEISELAGLENHLYCYPLNDILTIDEKFSLLKALFAVAASDGNVESVETEEIRIIARGLLLEHKYFIAAKATVTHHLQALKKI